MTDYGAVFANSSDRLDIHSAISMVGKELLTEFEPQVRAYLESDDEELVQQAILTLGMRWGLPDFKDEAEDMWRSLDNGIVRDAWFSSWVSYYTGSGDLSAAGEVRRVLADGQYSPRMRGTALGRLGRIFEFEQRISRKALRAVSDANSSEEAEAAIPWDLVNEICEEFGIEVVG